MPATEAALLAGQITVEHVRTLVDAKQLSPEAFTADEDRLVVPATRLRVVHFEKALAYWKHLHEPDLTEQRLRRRSRPASCPPPGRWTTSWSWTRCSIRSAAPSSCAELERLEQALWEADWADATARWATVPASRTWAVRGASDVRMRCGLMAERSAAKPADATEPRVLLQVLVGEESLGRICELSNGQVVTPGQLMPVLSQADVERVVFDGPSKVLDVGVRRRLFSGATRTAVLVRDRGLHPPLVRPPARPVRDRSHPPLRGGR